MFGFLCLWLAFDNSLLIEVEVPTSHIDMLDPQVEGGVAVLSERYRDVTPLKELPGRNGLWKSVRVEYIITWCLKTGFPKTIFWFIFWTRGFPHVSACRHQVIVLLPEMRRSLCRWRRNKKVEEESSGGEQHYPKTIERSKVPSFLPSSRPFPGWWDQSRASSVPTLNQSWSGSCLKYTEESPRLSQSVEAEFLFALETCFHESMSGRSVRLGTWSTLGLKVLQDIK